MEYLCSFLYKLLNDPGVTLERRSAEWNHSIESSRVDLSATHQQYINNLWKSFKLVTITNKINIVIVYLVA